MSILERKRFIKFDQLSDLRTKLVSLFYYHQ